MFKGMKTGRYYSQNCDINLSVEKLEQSTVSMKMTEMVMLNIVQGNGQSLVNAVMEMFSPNAFILVATSSLQNCDTKRLSGSHS